MQERYHHCLARGKRLTLHNTLGCQTAFTGLQHDGTNAFYCQQHHILQSSPDGSGTGPAGSGEQVLPWPHQLADQRLLSSQMQRCTCSDATAQ